MPKKNDVIQIHINELDFPNKGIGIYEDYKAVVKESLPEETVLAKVAKKKNGVIECRLLDVINKADYEIESKCPHFDICGGCSYQNITIEKEHEIKTKQVIKLIENAGIKNFVFDGIKSSPDIEGYRNKCEFSFGDTEKGGVLALGMRKKKSYYEVVNITDCNIAYSYYINIIKNSVEIFSERNVSFYHKARHDGCLRHLVVRKGAYTGEILINIVTANEIEFSLKDFVKMLTSINLEGKICSILHTQNDSVADVVKSDNTVILYGKDYFTDKLFDLEFKITAFSFFQTNTKGAEVLYSVVKDYAGDVRDKVIFDLYCGTGTIGQIMAKDSKKVIGIEIVEEAVDAANENAKINNIKNCSFIAGDVLKKIDEIVDEPDIIIVDPPREGINPKAISKICNRVNAEKIIYISCKPTSMVRDVSVLIENGYNVKRICCVNMFPKTRHVETVVLMYKNG